MNHLKPIISLVLSLILTLSCSDEDKLINQSNRAKENWYSVKPLGDHSWVIAEPKSSQKNVSYLIAGKNRAIMFDTGTGENSRHENTKILHLLKELTTVPITVLLSHFHFDHNANIAEFESVAFADLPNLRAKVDAEDKYKFSAEDLFLGAFPSVVTVNEWLPLNTDIDLGERSIQIISVPGHSDESVAVVDHDNKLAFLGDFVYNGTLFIFDSDDFGKYRKSISHFINILDDTYSIYGAHGQPLVSYARLSAIKELLDCIINSNCYETQDTTVFGKPATIYISLDKSTNILLVK